MTDRGRGLTTAEVGRRLGKSQRWVQRVVATGEMPAYQLGDRAITVFESDLEEFIESRRVRVGGAA